MGDSETILLQKGVDMLLGMFQGGLNLIGRLNSVRICLRLLRERMAEFGERLLFRPSNPPRKILIASHHQLGPGWSTQVLSQGTQLQEDDMIAANTFLLTCLPLIRAVEKAERYRELTVSSFGERLVQTAPATIEAIKDVKERKDNAAKAVESRYGLRVNTGVLLEVTTEEGPFTLNRIGPDGYCCERVTALKECHLE
ncbi:hypothetical protein EV356DRAFT_200140 [Viridothelium virens]|uniref:Uncharacterized protein n=1 Tax=Viridothelium virens TaxID=1048519 RepID=A0A6A6H6C1_VIRVR|nr:hypothetical protein EV356DRAFT_200140 [Viridothelium virens]